VYGRPGDDVLIGGAWEDTFYREAGRDVPVGGLGADVLFDSVVRVVGGSPRAPPALRQVFAAWDPDDPGN
jgi:Ca2+-binding RTX toxin-like protein